MANGLYVECNKKTLDERKSLGFIPVPGSHLARHSLYHRRAFVDLSKLLVV